MPRPRQALLSRRADRRGRRRADRRRGARGALHPPAGRRARRTRARRCTTTSPPRTRSSTRSPTASPAGWTSSFFGSRRLARGAAPVGGTRTGRRSPPTRTSCRTWPRAPGRRPAALAMADAVYGGLVDAGWPPARATHIGALMRYFVAGSALGSFARGFVEDPELYADQYPHLHPGAPARRAPAARRRGRVRPRPRRADRWPGPHLRTRPSAHCRPSRRQPSRTKVKTCTASFGRREGRDGSRTDRLLSATVTGSRPPPRPTDPGARTRRPRRSSRTVPAGTPTDVDRAVGRRPGRVPRLGRHGARPTGPPTSTGCTPRWPPGPTRSPATVALELGTPLKVATRVQAGLPLTVLRGYVELAGRPPAERDRRQLPGGPRTGRRGRRDHPVELPAAPGGRQGRRRRWPPAARWCSSRAS